MSSRERAPAAGAPRRATADDIIASMRACASSSAAWVSFCPAAASAASLAIACASP